jgi:DNA-binding MarR family transcriptional regulator
LIVSPRKESTIPQVDPTVLGQKLVQICRLHHMRAHTVFEAIGVYRAQPLVLDALWQHDGQTHSELATRLHVKPATITRMVQRMDHAGFLSRRRDQNDQRVSRVYLTRAGREIRSAIGRAINTIDTDTFAGFTPEECSTLQEMFQRIQDNLLQVTNSQKDE